MLIIYYVHTCFRWTSKFLQFLQHWYSFHYWSHSSDCFYEDKCFHWATLRFYHSNSSITELLSALLLQAFDIWLEITNLIGLGIFFTSFFQLSVQALFCSTWLVRFLHNSQCTLYCSAICWCSFKNLHN